MSIGLIFEKQSTLRKLVEPLSRKLDMIMTENQLVYAICDLPEIAGDVIWGQDVATIQE